MWRTIEWCEACVRELFYFLFFFWKQQRPVVLSPELSEKEKITFEFLKQFFQEREFQEHVRPEIILVYCEEGGDSHIASLSAFVNTEHAPFLCFEWMRGTLMFSGLSTVRMMEFLIHWILQNQWSIVIDASSFDAKSQIWIRTVAEACKVPIREEELLYSDGVRIPRSHVPSIFF